MIWYLYSSLCWNNHTILFLSLFSAYLLDMKVEPFRDDVVYVFCAMLAQTLLWHSSKIKFPPFMQIQIQKTFIQ